MHQAGWLVKALPPPRVVQPRVQSEPDREIENDADYGGRNAGERAREWLVVAQVLLQPRLCEHISCSQWSHRSIIGNGQYVSELVIQQNDSRLDVLSVIDLTD